MIEIHLIGYIICLLGKEIVHINSIDICLRCLHGRQWVMKLSLYDPLANMCKYNEV